MSSARWSILVALISVIACADLFWVRAALAGQGEDAWLKAAIQRQEVQSSNLASIGYHQKLRVLEIEFRSGAVYRYREVPGELFPELLKAKSKGRFFIERIRERYSCRKVVDPR